ncbi:dinucleotide-utilizing enzyme [Microbacterium sp.]|uniref:dinucleotide-utilizing enzyme n=1 Tax=Microbacterium sp. TaxID=51671 RepID=UPI002E32D081|nr:dinucleotide-utilizing enzyme [Microbacterium sp.]HEX5730218.1 dinucleotide-utilizing enzyme [Microbacterium sp.]
MTVRPSLVRSIPFWILLVGSLATAAVGAWLTVDKLAVMSVGLSAGTATPVDVYVGQVWAIIGGILLATGILGLALTLVTAVIRSFVPVTDVEIIEALDWSDDEDALENAPVAETTPVTETAPVVEVEPAPQR